MARTAKQVFTGNGTFTAPAGVTRVRVIAENLLPNKIFKSSSNELFIDQNGSVYAFGINANGQVGDGGITGRSSPVAVAGALSLVDVMTFGGGVAKGAMFGLDARGAAYAWGYNANGQLGTGNTTTISSPVAVTGGNQFKKIQYTSGTALALDFAGNAYAWGYNGNGQQGAGDTTDRSAPIAVVGGNTFKAIAMNQDGATGGCAFGIDSADALWAWGNNNKGQLGDGTVTPRSSPVAVVGGLTWKQVLFQQATSGSFASMLGLTLSGDVYVWGGSPAPYTGGTTGVSSPVLVMSGKLIRRIVSPSTGQSAIGLRDDGVAWAVGSNTKGQLGDGTATDRSSPVLVLGSHTFAQIVASPIGTMYGIDTTGQLWAWGDNTNGQIGDGTTAAKSSPVLVAGGKKWVAVYPDRANTTFASVSAIDTDGKMWSWGSNVKGELGDGSTTDRSSPVFVLGGYLPDPRFARYIQEFDVTPGNSYAVVCMDGMAVFGGNAFGLVANQLTLVYEQ